MSYESRIYEVPWCSDRWETAILSQPNVSFLGGRGRWVLYRPERLIVTKRSLDDDRVRNALTGAGADRCDDQATAIARALDLELLRAPEERVVSLVREINALDGCAASLNHVPIAGPHHIGGDDDPQAAADPGDVPGEGGDGDGVKVLVLDTGHASASTGKLHISGGDEEVVDDDHDGLRDPAAGHGTHICGVIARYAPGATIVPRRLLTTPAGLADDLHVAGALLEHDGAHIINCSFSEQALDGAPPLAIQEALAALPPTTVVVAATGNAGVSVPNWPAAFERVVAVGAVGRPAGSQDWLQTDFSNHGSWVDCCAPGVGVVSTFLKLDDEGFTSGYASWSGTSMATPAVAGTIAAMATSRGGAVAAAGSLETRVAEAAETVRGLPRVGDVGALVAA